MKKLRKISSILLLAAIMAGALSGCGKTGVCKGCGQTEHLKKYVEKSGHVEWYCADCHRMAKMFGD